MTAIDWKDAPEINDDMPHDELKMLAAVTWGDLAYERDENKHLRELASDMLACIKAHRDRRSICWECPHHKEVDELRSACFITVDASKLGVEVDE